MKVVLGKCRHTHTLSIERFASFLISLSEKITPVSEVFVQGCPLKISNSPSIKHAKLKWFKVAGSKN